ncbi:uncharacterized protein BcabD6B2_07710 [Babesia caballi]|uniref:Uncharacterized protein n=1 Tax=Babesia caballi TaxID=5871 RepID=A0AAV4LMT2_BABCB|nr:hypothetical protein, conserved [Babesia caballi]
MEPHGVINALANNLGREFLGYASQGGGFDFSGFGIIKKGNEYTSKYKDATWNGSESDTDMARIFLGATAITFWGLSFLDWKCSVNHGWSGEKLTGDSYSGLGTFMATMGYQSNYLDSNKNGTAVASLLEENGKGFDDLAKADTYATYENFVKELERKYDSQNNALNSPLTACYKFAKEYFKYKFKNAGDVEGNLTAIKDALKKLKISCENSASDLKDAIETFIQTCLTKPKKSNDPSTSHAGPIAGTLTTLGLGGGAAAAYMFNFGGAKTRINGLLRIS